MKDVEGKGGLNVPQSMPNADLTENKEWAIVHAVP